SCSATSPGTSVAWVVLRSGESRRVCGSISTSSRGSRAPPRLSYSTHTMDHPPFFRTRGVGLTPEDLTLADWPERAWRAGLTTIALHPFPEHVACFCRSEAGQAFLERCRTLGLQVEYELHAAGELLPRSLFDRNPELFRMDDEGGRTPDANLCVHAAGAVAIAAETAPPIRETRRPPPGRYFLWGDDARPWCRCARCRDLSDSDQALLLATPLLRALRRVDHGAGLAPLAYHNTLWPPTGVKPEP